MFFTSHTRLCPNIILSFRDGTLITQRLHFSQGHELFPHVLGWYRIAKELNDNGISSICVFDGETRSGAKAREACIQNFLCYNNLKSQTNLCFYFSITFLKVKRRRDLRELAATRGSIESDRFQRLNKLKRVAERFQGFDIDGKRFVAERLSLSVLQEQESPKQESPLEILPLKLPLQEIPPLKPPPLPVYPVCIELPLP